MSAQNHGVLQRKIVVDGHKDGGWKPGVFLVVDEHRCNSHWDFFSGTDAKERADAFAVERNRVCGFMEAPASSNTEAT